MTGGVPSTTFDSCERVEQLECWSRPAGLSETFPPDMLPAMWYHRHRVFALIRPVLAPWNIPMNLSRLLRVAASLTTLALALLAAASPAAAQWTRVTDVP